MLAVALGVVTAAPAGRGQVPDVLTAVSAVPAHVVGRFGEDAVFAAARNGDYVILDRRGHSVYVGDPAGTRMRRILGAGLVDGELFNPMTIALNEGDFLAVADAPNGYDRIQYFNLSGLRIGGFYLPLLPEPRLSIPDVLIASGSSLVFSGSTFIVNRPEWRTLVSELGVDGRTVRQTGHLRPTGHAPDPDLETGLNVGIPLVTRDGGLLFVFQTGLPAFRKYDRSGRLLFERHIEGPELDPRIQALPTTWTRPAGTRPVVPPLVRAAALDGQGRLWVSLVVPYTYVYDAAGEKVRTVQFRGAGIVSPSSLFFTAAGRLLVGPGGYEFDVDRPGGSRRQIY